VASGAGVDAVLLLGPTACGKSAFALRAAEQVALEIVSVDSAQVYRGMDIGTAKPSAAERARVPHHLIDLRDPAGYFLASKFEIRNKDVIYVSNASSVEASKFLTYVRLIVGTINDPIIAGISAYTLKAAIQGTSNATVLVGSTTAGH